MVIRDLLKGVNRKSTFFASRVTLRRSLKFPRVKRSEISGMVYGQPSAAEFLAALGMRWYSSGAGQFAKERTNDGPSPQAAF